MGVAEPKDAPQNMIAVCTLLLDGKPADAAHYINELGDCEARCLAAYTCQQILHGLREIADEYDCTPEGLLRAVALKAAAT